MTGNDALTERFLERLNRIAEMQSSEWWSDLQRAFAIPVDRVAARAIGPRQLYTPLHTRRFCGCLDDK
jgi:hypothetical protein